MFTSKDGKEFKTESDKEAYELITGQRDITNNDLDKALEYMKENIPCMEFEKSCGTHIGCSTCPYHHFKLTVKAAFEKCRE